MEGKRKRNLLISMKLHFINLFSALMYLKFICIWGVIMAADFLLEFRFEYLWPFWLVLRSICDSFKYQGLVRWIDFLYAKKYLFD
jgi:hypothetical protein